MDKRFATKSPKPTRSNGDHNNSNLSLPLVPISPDSQETTMINPTSLFSPHQLMRINEDQMAKKQAELDGVKSRLEEKDEESKNKSNAIGKLLSKIRELQDQLNSEQHQRTLSDNWLRGLIDDSETERKEMQAIFDQERAKWATLDEENEKLKAEVLEVEGLREKVRILEVQLKDEREHGEKMLSHKETNRLCAWNLKENRKKRFLDFQKELADTKEQLKKETEDKQNVEQELFNVTAIFNRLFHDATEENRDMKKELQDLKDHLDDHEDWCENKQKVETLSQELKETKAALEKQLTGGDGEKLKILEGQALDLEKILETANKVKGEMDQELQMLREKEQRRLAHEQIANKIRLLRERAQGPGTSTEQPNVKRSRFSDERSTDQSTSAHAVPANPPWTSSTF